MRLIVVFVKGSVISQSVRDDERKQAFTYITRFAPVVGKAPGSNECDGDLSPIIAVKCH
jgi:hypothetical protein